MAKIVLGIGTSHGPLLLTPPEQWTLRGETDKRNSHPFRGKDYKFEELLAARAGEHREKDIELAVRTKHYNDCQVAIEKLSELYHEAKPDVAVIFGNDQMEMFTTEQIPSFLVYTGKDIETAPPTEEEKIKMDPGILVAELRRRPPAPKTYPGLPELGLHVTKALMEAEFDVAVSNTLPKGKIGRQNVPHAFAFIYEAIMKGNVQPNLPLFTNTFYPPNQPTAKRCFDMGATVVKAIESWDSDARVVVFGSGGLTHFSIDEELDRRFLDAMQRNDKDALCSIEEELLQAGTSELKNWIPLAASMMHLGWDMNLIDYVPCYRTEAGTGNAMGFAYWKA